MPSRRTAAVPAAARKGSSKDEATSLFSAQKRNYGIGSAIQPRRDLSRMLKWPRHIRIQRQRKVLKMRLKVPPSIAQFSQTLDLNMGARLPRPRSPRAGSIAAAAPVLVHAVPLTVTAWGCHRAATNLFKLLDKYRPEEKAAKKARLAGMVGHRRPTRRGGWRGRWVGEPSRGRVSEPGLLVGCAGERWLRWRQAVLCQVRPEPRHQAD
jgi:hypothetical protein